jgi:hypothetical protein
MKEVAVVRCDSFDPCRDLFEDFANLLLLRLRESRQVDVQLVDDVSNFLLRKGSAEIPWIEFLSERSENWFSLPVSNCAIESLKRLYQYPPV